MVYKANSSQGIHHKIKKKKSLEKYKIPNNIYPLPSERKKPTVKCCIQTCCFPWKSSEVHHIILITSPPLIRRRKKDMSAHISVGIIHSIATFQLSVFCSAAA